MAKSEVTEPLKEKFLPIVKKVTTQVKLVETYNQWSGKLNKLGLAGQPVDLEAYVTNKALDGLFMVVAQKEQEIRKNPFDQGSTAIKKIFGSVIGK